MNTKFKFYMLFLFSISLSFANAQWIKRALFIGNSYTDVNNLPYLVSKIARAHGDSLYYEANVPGGSTLYAHSINSITLAKIAQGNWDFVALQAQSQEPSFSPNQVAAGVLPYAHKLDSLIHKADSCAETVFYMTWGRKNGDAGNCTVYPPVCTYSGMQSRLRSSYLLMAQQNNASVAPVGAAWREVNNANPSFDLYQPDESHPSIYGSYLAACVFYSTFFQRPVKSLSFTAGISLADASFIQQKCNSIVFDSLQTWYENGLLPFISYNYQQNGDTVRFINTSLNSTFYNWLLWGDNGNIVNTSIENPIYIKSTAAEDTIFVSFAIGNSCNIDSVLDTVYIPATAIKEWNETYQPFIQYSASECQLKIVSASDLAKWSLEIYSLEGKLIHKGRAQSVIPLVLNRSLYLCKLHHIPTGKSVQYKMAAY